MCARPTCLFAWLNVTLHIAALVLAAAFIRPGSPLVTLKERLDYLGSTPVGWTCAWVAWILCAVALIAFLATVTSRLGEQSPWAQIGLMIAVAGIGFDLLCDSIYILIFPMVALQKPPPETLFLTIERATAIASLVIANGAYSVGILLITLAMRHRQNLAPFTTVAGYAVACFGLLLAAAGFTGIPWHAACAGPLTIGLFCVWVILVARSLEPAGRFP